jgi:hypothetical protein
MSLGGFAVGGLPASVRAEPPIAAALPLVQSPATSLALAALLDNAAVDYQTAAGLIVFRLPGRHEVISLPR